MLCGVTLTIVRAQEEGLPCNRIEPVCTANEQDCVTKGGGIFVFNSAPTIRNVLVRLNRAIYGAGIYAIGGFNGSYLSTENVTVHLNRAVALRNQERDSIQGSGAGMFLSHVNGGTHLNLQVTDNWAITSGGGKQRPGTRSCALGPAASLH